MAFVTMGFEHSIANMYFIPTGIFTLGMAEHAELVHKYAEALNWVCAVKNIGFATLGNIIGGSFFVGTVYWFIHLKDQKK